MVDSDEIFVLVFDRDNIFLQTLSGVIESLDNNVSLLTPQTVEEAAKLPDQHNCALALIDVSQPGNEGFVLADRIGAMPGGHRIPLIFLCHPEEGAVDALEACRKGALDVLTKPVHPLVLQTKIGFYVSLNRERAACPPSFMNQKDVKKHVGRAISELAGGIAHQFNNALNIITGNVELLKLDIPGNHHVSVFSEVVFDSVKKMTALTDKLLAYARAGHYNPSQMEFNGVLRDVLADIDVRDKKIEIKSYLDVGHILVEADEEQLKIVFSALIKNAREAVDNHGHIVVRSRYIPSSDAKGLPAEIAMQNMVCFDVEDDGQGMEPDVVERIFEPFFSTKFQGRGLDMAAVQGIVNNHKGFIDVDSDVGKGTRVSVFLPVTSYRKPTVFHSPDLRGTATGNVLVIDDDKDLRGMTVTMLDRLGYRPLTASTGREAITMLNRPDIQVDLALLDIEMPDMKGNEIYPYLKLAHPGLKVVVCSGYSIDGPVQQLLQQGAQMFLQKPFSFGALARSLQKLIERRQNPRFEVREGFIAVPQGKTMIENELIDISIGGASIHSYCYPEDYSAWKNMSIVTQDGVKISGIPFQFIDSTPYFQKTPREEVGRERLSLRFGSLDPALSSQVDTFISQCTK